jgi:predicted enzyme related to lactoylglutathione lyase
MVNTMFKYDGVYTAGLGPMMPGMEAIPSHWTSYVSVDDVDAIVAKAESLGATVVAPIMDIFESGRMAVIADPTGAQLGLWQPKNHNGAGIVNVPGAPTWNEIYTRDLSKAKAFFSALFGWTYDSVEGMDQESYVTISNKGRMNGGMMQMSEVFGDAPPYWMVYFSVADIDATVARAKELGGKLVHGVEDAGDIGRFAIIEDPAGAAASYIQLQQPLAWDM